MSPDEIDKLTIAEVRAIAERAHEALARLRDVQSLLGGAVAPTQPAQVHATSAAVSPTSYPPTRTHTPLEPGEAEAIAARRAALLADSRAAAEAELAKAKGAAS